MTPYQLEQIGAAMDILEQMPCGGIGSHGPTADELLAQAENDDIDDATYWAAQYAWRILARIYGPAKAHANSRKEVP